LYSINYLLPTLSPALLIQCEEWR